MYKYTYARMCIKAHHLRKLRTRFKALDTCHAVAHLPKLDSRAAAARGHVGEHAHAGVVV